MVLVPLLKGSLFTADIFLPPIGITCCCGYS
jgi:hypothetical protein